MAFIREYGAQGDPLPLSRLVGSTLVRSPFSSAGRFLPTTRRKVGFVPMVSHPIGFRRGPAFRGDPFLGKLFKKAGKALKKITLKGAVKAVGGVARTVLPIVAPGVGSVVANLIPVPRAAEPAPAPAPVSPEMVEPQVAPPSATATMTQQEFDELVQHFVNQIIADAQQGLLRDARMRF